LGDGKYFKQVKDYADCKGFVEDPNTFFKDAKYAFVSRYLSILEAIVNKKLIFAIYDNDVKEDYLKMAPYAKWIMIEKTPIKIAEKLLYYESHQEEAETLIRKAYDWGKLQTWDKMVGNYIKLWGLR
jgi:hypothetical protein